MYRLLSRSTAARLGARSFTAQAQMSPVPVVVTHKNSLINGSWVDADRTFDVVDPRTEELVCTFAEASVADVDAAVGAARKAFDEGPWPRMTGYERGRIIHKLADLIEENATTMGNLETLDNGKPVKYSIGADVGFSVTHLRYMAGWADKIAGQTISSNLGQYQNNVYMEPIGVAAQIVPWNFPLLMAIWKVAPSLAVGCTSVLKTSEKTPLTGAMLGALALEAGVPEGVLNVLSGKNVDACKALVQDVRVDKVAFTGSVATAQKVGHYIHDSNVKPYTQELGGKSPALIFQDADVDAAVAGTHFGLFFNHGQCCCASSRVFVHEKIYDEFLEKAVKAAEDRPVGDPFTDVEQGPLVDRIQFDKVQGYVEAGRASGATVAAGGNRLFDKGYFLEPTIFTNVDESSKIWQEEIFGPVLGIAKFSDEDDVVRRANATNFGLAAGIWSNDVNTVNRVAKNLRAGTVWVNCYNVFDNSTPFGGYKDSGTGREKGEFAIKNYLQTKCVVMPQVGFQAYNR